jgi:hypothetical protein
MRTTIRRLPIAVAGLLLGGAAIAIASGIGPVAAATPSSPSTPQGSAASAAPPALPSAGLVPGVRARLRAIIRNTTEADLTVVGRNATVYQVRYARGLVTAVDAQSITVALRSGGSATFGVSGATRVRVDGRRAAVADLHVGDDVQVFGLRSGDAYDARLIREVAANATLTPDASPAVAPGGTSDASDQSGATDLLDALGG